MECTIPRVNPNVDYELWEIMMCQCRFIIGNKYTAFMVHVDNEVGAVHLWGQRNLNASAQFAMTLKPLYKNKIKLREGKIEGRREYLWDPEKVEVKELRDDY